MMPLEGISKYIANIGHMQKSCFGPFTKCAHLLINGPRFDFWLGRKELNLLVLVCLMNITGKVSGVGDVTHILLYPE